MNKYLPWRATLLIAAASLILVDIGYLEFGFPGLLLGWATYLWHVTQTEWRPWKTVLLSVPLVLTPIIGIWQEVHVLGIIAHVVMMLGVIMLTGAAFSRQLATGIWYFALLPVVFVPVVLFGTLSYGIWSCIALGVYFPLMAWRISVWRRRIWQGSEFQEEVDAEYV